MASTDKSSDGAEDGEQVKKLHIGDDLCLYAISLGCLAINDENCQLEFSSSATVFYMQYIKIKGLLCHVNWTKPIKQQLCGKKLFVRNKEV